MALALLGATLLLLAACGESPPSDTPTSTTAEAPPGPPPNIVFIMVDDLGRDLLGMYDLDERVEIATPNLDRLAAEGVVFDNAYASPVCLVTRAELLTGRYPFHNGMLGHVDDRLITGEVFLDPKYQPSFAQPLKQAGYATAMAGKWHGNNILPGEQARVPRAFGFDEWRSGDPDATAPARMFTHEGVRRFDAFPADALADFVLDFVRRHRDQPFFVYWPTYLVHRPLVPTPLQPDATTDAEKLIAMTEYVDDLVGRLLDTLDELGLADNTVVFFSGDNGGATTNVYSDEEEVVWTNGKGTLTERGVRVPFVVSGGPVVRRGRTEALTDFTDLLPTLADFAGVELAQSYRADGVSIASFLTGRAADTPRNWIAASAAVWPNLDPGMGYSNLAPTRAGMDRYAWETAAMGVVLRDRRFKLWDYPLGPKRLFDLRRDPNEEENLWDSGARDVVAAKERLLEIRAGLPTRPAPLLRDRIGSDHGLFAHWSFDTQLQVGGRQVFPDSVGGYDARLVSESPDVAPVGKFGRALLASPAPPEAEQFARFFPYRGAGGWTRRSFTLSAWVKLDGSPAQTWHVFRQPTRAEGPVFGARLHAVMEDGATAWLDETSSGHDPGMGSVEITFDGEPRPLARGERRTVTVTASGLDPSRTHRMELRAAGQGLGTRADCSYRSGDLRSADFTGVTSHSETFTVFGCAATTADRLSLAVTPAGQLVFRANTAGGRTNRLSAALPASDDWVHLAVRWDAGDAALHVNGQEVASGAFGDVWVGTPAERLLLGGLAGDGSTPVALMDDAAVWRQALRPAQIAATHALGESFGYNAAQVDTLFNTPREYPVAVAGERWERVSGADASGGEGFRIAFGDGIVVRPVPEAGESPQ